MFILISQFSTFGLHDSEFSFVFRHVFTAGVELGRELLPVVVLVVDQVADDTTGSALLRGRTLFTVRFYCFFNVGWGQKKIVMLGK